MRILQQEWAQGIILLVEFLTEICDQLREVTKKKKKKECFLFPLALQLSFFWCYRQTPNAPQNLVSADLEEWGEYF